MPLWSAFCGGAYTARSTSIAADAAINLYVETREVAGSPKQTTMYGTPGLVRDTDLSVTATAGSRGAFTQDGRSWRVIADTLYETTTGTSVAIGTIPNDGLPVFFASNGQGGDQLGISGGGELNVLDLVTGTLTTAVLPFSNPVMIVFQDGYALINQKDTPIVWFSTLEDMLTWDALDFFARSGTSDNCVGLGISQDRIWVFGSKTSTLYYDSGDADNPFLPYSGTTAQNGLVSPYLVSVYRDTFLWVSSAARGTYKVMAGTSPAGEAISTHPIETWLAGATTLDDATSLLYEQEGHVFFAISAPSSPDELKTYAVDLTEKLWHARADWDDITGTYLQWRCADATAIDGVVYVGDRTNGNVYTLDLDAYDNDGDVLRRERCAPYLSADNQFLTVYQFQLGTQAGVGLSSGQGSEPVANLEISRDNGHNWVDAGSAPLGAIGEYKTRTKWGPLGTSISGAMLFKVTMTDPVKCVWGPGAWLRTEPGTGQL